MPAPAEFMDSLQLAEECNAITKKIQMEKLNAPMSINL